MKKYFLIILIVFGFFSCEDYLDKRYDIGVTEAMVFNDFGTARGFFDNVYLLINDYRAYEAQNATLQMVVAQLSDECANVFNVYAPNNNIRSVLNTGNWLSGNDVPETGWSTNRINNNFRGLVIPQSFLGLRICNRILEVAPAMTQLTQEQKDELMGQAYFFRGWFYFEIIRRVGGMPLFDRIYTSYDDPNMPRLTYAQSSQWIIENMDAAKELLPHRWPDAQTGRPTKSAAYALKSMAQLYAASPLMRNGIEQTVRYVDYDEEAVKLAAQYAKECLDYIYITNIENDQTMMPGNEYAHIFYFPTDRYVSRESLWYFLDADRRHREVDIVAWQTVTMNARMGEWGPPHCCVTQNMVDMFETQNGYPVKLTVNGWETDDPDFDADEPFKGRDPRLYNNILLPGERFGTRAAAAAGVQTPDNQAFYLAAWEGGREYLIRGTAAPGTILTRYINKKYQWPTSINGSSQANNPAYGHYTFNSVFIRTTQVWLDYAEAMNEAYGPQANPENYQWGSALDALNRVRARVGHAPVLGMYTNDKVALRERIRNERAVELMFENHRWFDIRRWMIAEDLFAGANPIKGVRVHIKDGETFIGPQDDGFQLFPPGATEQEREQAHYGKPFTYTLYDVTEETRVFNLRNYWYPIGRDEINRNPGVRQNPGW